MQQNQQISTSPLAEYERQVNESNQLDREISEMRGQLGPLKERLTELERQAVEMCGTSDLEQMREISRQRARESAEAIQHNKQLIEGRRSLVEQVNRQIAELKTGSLRA
ncbi:hypothetical protein [Neptuniibacter sp. QD37_11]|uniref:hypothetical protein n=1 Tax=Neptuniibacter sp. QD37_11 TaxID=3398209 RepID=UPI0039F4886D